MLNFNYLQTRKHHPNVEHYFEKRSKVKLPPPLVLKQGNEHKSIICHKNNLSKIRLPKEVLLLLEPLSLPFFIFSVPIDEDDDDDPIFFSNGRKVPLCCWQFRLTSLY
mmetsp:Transcript_12232/g.13936  ORF Transcript_12232/g.13936 Transcript_12232/m.13936 type:complete len:108 (+) Transcript_12232:302-625(+)